ncbi:adenine phosphoribosyltransferase [Flagellimonas sp. DF-77]|uniref:adenine phosphoribosyltransferase n=1 Tax=Flagellimonas algarum TaxID=3230298 RepID=UPI003396080C
MDLNSYVRDVPDFPKPGVVFKDITPLLKSPQALMAALDGLCDLVPKGDVDLVVGVDSRGFIFAPMMASRLGAGFIPVRKKGKLPHTTLSQSYDLEYGTDTLEIHADAIRKGDKVLVHDDVLATGGTAKAVCDLVERSGGIIVQCNFLIELDFLQGSRKLGALPVGALLHY